MEKEQKLNEIISYIENKSIKIKQIITNLDTFEIHIYKPNSFVKKVRKISFYYNTSLEQMKSVVDYIIKGVS